METLELIKPTVALETEYREMVAEHLAEYDDRRSGFVMDPIGECFTEYVCSLEEEEKGNELPTGYVTQSTYWLVLNGSEIVGVSRLRHKLTPSLEIEGGHIGYMIRPSKRRRGYGTMILRKTLEKAVELGLERVLVTCYTDNIASGRVILRNGGVPTTSTVSPRTGRPVSRYWIELRELP